MPRFGKGRILGKINCQTCGKEINKMSFTQKYCPECSAEKRRLDVVKFTAYGKPETKGSAKAFVVKPKNGRARAVITNDNLKNKDWHNVVALVAQANRPVGGIFTEAVKVKLDFCFSRPKSISVKQRPYHTVKPDLDKIIRSVLDALKGVIYNDDSQVVDLKSTKEYGPEPSVTVEVREAGA